MDLRRLFAFAVSAGEAIGYLTLGVSVLALGVWWRRRWVDRHVSTDWLVDASRREWGTGIDQTCVRKWPINKFANEHAQFQTQRLRRRA